MWKKEELAWLGVATLLPMWWEKDEQRFAIVFSWRQVTGSIVK